MKSTCLTTPRLVLAAVLTCVALPIAAQAAAITGSRLENNLSGSSLGGIYGTTSNPSSSHQVTSASDAKGDGSMLAEGFATSGAVGANANIDFHGSNSNSGSLRAVASATWYETISITVPTQFQVNNVYLWELGYQVSANGGVGAVGMQGLTGANATISYDFVFGQSHRTGYQSINSSGDSSISAPSTWGSVGGSTQVAANGSLYLAMSGYADAQVGNAFAFGNRTASADAVFGSTLLWGGIVSVSAFNTSGQLIDLPDDFYLDLIGQDSGFNYWNAAVHPNAPAGVPDAGSAALMLAPVLLFLAAGRRFQERAAVRC